MAVIRAVERLRGRKTAAVASPAPRAAAPMRTSTYLCVCVFVFVREERWGSCRWPLTRAVTFTGGSSHDAWDKQEDELRLSRPS